MNPNRGLARLGQPRSNTATNLLFAITFVVFAMMADMAIDQQNEAFANGSTPVDTLVGQSAPTSDLRALARPHF